MYSFVVRELEEKHRLKISEDDVKLIVETFLNSMDIKDIMNQVVELNIKINRTMSGNKEILEGYLEDIIESILQLNIFKDAEPKVQSRILNKMIREKIRSLSDKIVQTETIK